MLPDNGLAREGVLRVVDHVWTSSVHVIRELIDDLNGNLTQENRDRLEDSFNVLRRIRESLSDEDYQRSEDHLVFHDFALAIPDAYKHALRAYMYTYSIHPFRDTHPIDASSANIRELSDAFYNDLENRLQRNIRLVYSFATKMIKYLRDNEEHGDRRPLDHITGENSFGSIYTLGSIFVIATYAYIEILRHWKEVTELIPATP